MSRLPEAYLRSLASLTDDSLVCYCWGEVQLLVLL